MNRLIYPFRLFSCIALWTLGVDALAYDGLISARTSEHSGIVLRLAQVLDESGTQPAPQIGRDTHLTLREHREKLSNGSPDWTDTSVEIMHHFAPCKTLSGTVTESSRFGLVDRTLTMEGYYPLSERTTANLLVAGSDTHRVLARSNLHAQLHRMLGNGWGVAGGARRANYNNASVEIADLTLERDFSDYRAALSVLPAHSSTAGSAPSYRAQFAWYYGNENRLQFMMSRGTEVDRPTGVNLVIATPVRSTVVYGQNWLSLAWALDYSVGRTTQGSVARNAVGVGLRHSY